MTDHRKRLQELLRELFQFDSADLDFGIYRVMNQRRAEIDEFIERGLLDAVAQEFALLQADAAGEKRAELEKVANEVRAAYGDTAIVAGNVVPQFAQLPLALRFAAKKVQVEQATVSVEAEADIFNYLYTFFSRYYADGDFISTRRYSQTHKYAIPYNGEEVYLHWANRDQYYIKTADVLNDYAFVVGPHNEYRVRFEIARADTEQGNVKSDNRYFVPVKRDLANYDEGRGGVAPPVLTLRFEYRPLADDEKETHGKTNVQAKIIEASRDRLLKAVSDTSLRGYLAAKPREDDERSLLEIQLHKWTRKSTSDYFVHKDLRAFLNRELDFYIKNEVVRLDNIDDADAPRVESYLTRVKVIKRIARTVIDFLAQIEDFQKRLFEKPKFVLESNWCVTLDRVPPSLFAAIAANDQQWDEWKRLFDVARPRRGGVTPPFLAAHPFLTVDTALYDAAFKDQLLAALSAREGGLAAQTDGLLIHGENLQALNLLLPTYRERVKCIYIDPPYNTGNDGFVYKDNFQHSTWLAMMDGRLRLARELLSDDGVIFTSIDDGEQFRLAALQEAIFGESNFVANIIWQKKYSPQNDAKWFSDNHDFIPCFARDKNIWRPNLLPRTETQNARYKNPDSDPRGLWKSSGLDVKTYSAEYDYPITTPSGRVAHPPGGSCWRVSKQRLAELIADNRIWFGDKGDNVPSIKRFLSEVKEGITPLTIWTYDKVGHTQEGAQELNDLFIGGSILRSPKVVRLLKRIINIGADDESIILDFFGGSGTTAHAVINLNREDDGNRKYILVEQGAYFDTVLKPRIQKVIYARDWKEGKPVDGSEGSSHCFQYLRLESYEDTLDNLDLKRPSAPVPTLFPEDHDEYLLKYMLDHETRETRLNVAAFATPFDYKLRVRRNGVETQVGVDLVETANYLLGLTVTARRVLAHQGRVYRVVEGTVGDDSIVVIWRNTQMLNLQKEAAFVQEKILADHAFDRVYINGDSHVPNATPIETVFVNAMR